MANGLMGLSSLLGQSSNATSGGLFGGPGIFTNAPSRAERRERLLSSAIQSQQTSAGRLGAAFGGLIGTALSGVGPGTEEEQRNAAIREVQGIVSQEGLDPLDPQFGPRVAQLFTERNLPQLATTSLLQARALQSQFAPEPQETQRIIRGGTPEGEAAGLLETQQAVGTFVDGRRTGLSNLSEIDSDEEKGDAVNVRLADGSFVRGIELQDGRVVDLQNREFPASANIVGLDLAASKQSDLPKTDIDILNNKQIGVKNYRDLVNEAISIYNENPNVNTLAAEGTRILSGIRSEFDALLDISGINLAEDTSRAKLLNIDTYESAFEDIALENAALKPLYLSLALSQAQAEAEQLGKALSDKDVERFIRQQGGQYGNPRFATEILRRNANRLTNQFKNEYEVRTGNEFDVEFDPILEFNPNGQGSTEIDFQANVSDAISSGPQAVIDLINNATDEQLESLDQQTADRIAEILGGGQ